MIDHRLKPDAIMVHHFRYCGHEPEFVNLASMKMPVRILIGLIGLVVIVLGVKQIYKGVHEMSGTSAASTQKLGETYTSTENGYSHRIPEGWQTKPSPQAGVVAMIVSPSESGVSSNMITTVELFDGSLTDYVVANKQAVSAQAPGAKFLNDAEFVTDSKTTAHKVKLQNKMKDIDLAQTMYFFDGTKGRKIIVTCTAPANYGDKLESICDGCMKTFAIK